MKILKEKSLTDVKGFKAVGIHCGIKKNGKKDLAIIYSEKPAVAAGVFTKNKVKAAPLQITMENINNEGIQGIIVNSGNANACTGEKGLANGLDMVNTLAKTLNIDSKQVLVGSTGIIGVPLPMNIIIPGIKKASSLLSKKGGKDAAEAIMTTDSFPKMMTVEIEIDGKRIYISGIAKGSGMIHPNMATMLGFIVTDINISKEMLTKALKDSVSDSYNMISVDGDTSTNDMVIALANGVATNKKIDTINDDYLKFKEALDFVNIELAKMIAKDGEGATKLIEVSLLNARSKEDAKLCAKSVISSNLVKSAFFGCDANWGRIMCSLGYSDGSFNPDKVDVFFESKEGNIQLVNNGMGLNFDEEKALKILKNDYVKIIIDLKDGVFNSKAWGCDLSYDYVKINGSYRT